jgi:two-component system, cell cycle response regulator
MRSHAPVSVLLCDVDNFKQINDVHGHPIGDEVLQEVSSRLLDAVRLHDAVGRYGGEEFLVVLNGCGHEDVKVRAEEVRRAIDGRPVATAHGPIPVSLSVGAITIEKWDKYAAIEPYLKQADQALYRAKAAGRNVVMYAPLLVGV